LQRKCDCGTHTIGGEQCDKCGKTGLGLQRSAVNPTPPPTAPPIVHDVLDAPGRALDTPTRAFMESQFNNFGLALTHTSRSPQLAQEGGLAVGPADDQFEHEADGVAARLASASQPTSLRSSPARYDFSRVRVHTDERAAQSARAVGALAFTVGQNIVFGSGQYAPATVRGRALLAHELTHVVQQSQNLRRATLQRSVGGFLRNIFINFPVIGFFLHFSQEELEGYLKKLDETGKIEDDSDSDNKAVEIANAWNRGDRKFVLTARRKALLILEMLSGYVSDDDEGAILGLLERSDNPELEYIFGEGQVKHEKLLSKLSSTKEQLYRFYQRRFSTAYPDLTLDQMMAGGAPPAKPDLQKLKDAKPGGTLVQPGDELPKRTGPYYSAVKSKETKRRTELVTLAEADSWVSEVYGQFLPKDKVKQAGETKGHAAKNVPLRTETPQDKNEPFISFLANCLQFELDKLTRKQRQDEDEKRKARAKCDAEEPGVAGFFDADSNDITVRTDRESPSTRLHEVVHAYADKSVNGKLTRYAMEGLTEYLTRQILSRHKLIKDEKRLAVSQSYGGPHDAILELSLIVGDAALAKAHFQGDVEGLAQVLGQDVFAKWLKLMEESDGWQEAVKLLRQRKTAQPGKVQKKAASPFVGARERIASRPRLAQTALGVGQANDQFEREADHVAERLMRSSWNETETSARGLMKEREMTISRKPEHEGGTHVPPEQEAEIDALTHGGAALPAPVRARFEPRFNHDFSRVRLHTDARAAESARAVNALAYTRGSHIVFGAGRYAPSTQEGDKLLAHELTHVVQQHSSSDAEGRTVQRKGGSFTGFFSKLGRSIASIFGGGGGFGEETLQEYLRGLDNEGDIEDDFDSDFKARAVVNAWRLGGSPYVLTERRKALLIREMQEGATGDDDEMAILEILERSYNFELSYIFGAGGVKVKDLNSDFHGEEWDRLKDFYARRFEDSDAMIKGSMSKPMGLPVALGVAMPFLGSWMSGDDLPGAKPEWNVPCVLGILCSEDKAVVSKLPQLKVQKADKVTEVYWEYEGAAWKMKTRERGAYSNADLKTIGLKKSANCPTAAEHIVHEVHHQGQPDTWTTAEKEKDAYTFAEEWSIKRGLPGRSDMRTTKPGSKEEVPDAQAIEQHVADRYSGSGGGAPGAQIVGHTSAGKTLVVMSPGQTPIERTAQQGDSHQDFDQTKSKLDGLPKVDPKEWVCPKIK
jgi:hypothetical protein